MNNINKIGDEMSVTLKITRSKKGLYGYTIHAKEELPAVVVEETLRSYSIAFAAAQPQIAKLLKRG